MVTIADPLKKGSYTIVILADPKRKVVVLLWF
jgi:hypothetical protein